jgi:hypothetical protein
MLEIVEKAAWIAAFGFVIAVIVFSVLRASSQQPPNRIPPIIHQSKGANKSANQSDGKQSSATNPMSPTNVPISDNIAAKSGENESSANSEGTKWTDPIVLFTFLLVVVGGFQAGFLWRGIDDSKTALFATQRAFVFINTFENPHYRQRVSGSPKVGKQWCYSRQSDEESCQLEQLQRGTARDLWLSRS